MIEHMDSLVKLGVDLSPEERNLLSIGYKNFMGAKRFAWRTVAAAADESERKGGPEHGCFVKFRKAIEEEMRQLAHRIIHYIEKYLYKEELEPEPKAFYHKL